MNVGWRYARQRLFLSIGSLVFTLFVMELGLSREVQAVEVGLEAGSEVTDAICRNFSNHASFLDSSPGSSQQPHQDDACQ